MYQEETDSFSLYSAFHDKTLLGIEDCIVLGLCSHIESKDIFPQGVQNHYCQGKGTIKRKVKRKGCEIEIKPPQMAKSQEGIKTEVTVGNYL